MNGLPDQAKGIMVVDDDPGRRRLISLFLKHAGFIPLSVPGGEAALEALEMVVPDLFVISADLVDMHGVDLCRRIRVSPESAQSPMLMLVMRQDSRSIPDDADIDAVLTIPFVGFELVNMVHSLLSNIQ